MKEYWKKFLDIAKTRSPPNESYNVLETIGIKEYDNKPVIKLCFIVYELWEENEMTPEQFELREMFRDGKLPNPFPILEGEEI